MLKKLSEKKIALFKEYFPDYSISKKGNFYVKNGVSKKKRRVVIGGISITKNMLSRLGEVREWETEVAQEVLMLTPRGRMMVSQSGSAFKTVTLRNLSRGNDKIADIFFIGRKYEWMKDYPELASYRYFQGFNSLAEAKNYLGFDFINNEQFYSMFSNFSYRNGYDIMSIILRSTNKANIHSLLSSLESHNISLLYDYINLCEPGQIDFPAGKNKLKELHDQKVFELQKEDAENYSKQVRYKYEDVEFEKDWTNRGIEFKQLQTPYEMYITGLQQKHCIGTNYMHRLSMDSFYTITWKGNDYQIQIYSKGSVGEFNGYNNRVRPPQDLMDLINDKEINYTHKVVEIKGDYKDYPKKKVSDESKAYPRGVLDDEW